MDDDNIENEGTHTFRSSMAIRAATLTTKDRSSLLDLAKQRAPDPDIFDEEGNEPFFWTARASNQNIDSYYTRMDVSSLDNYVADATDPGVQFQNSHNGSGLLGGEVGFGRSLSGRVTGKSGAKEALIDFYAIPGLACGNMTSDQFIRGTRSGIYSDVSIGFIPGQMICSICGHDWLKRWDWIFDDDAEDGCTHWPGKEYQIGEGRSKKKVRCILDVMNGRLSEVSTVYDGATPGAGIAAVELARMMSAEGKLNEADRVFVENFNHVRIAPPPGMYGGVDLSYAVAGGTKVANRTTKTSEDRVEDQVEEKPETDVTDDDDGGRIDLGAKKVKTADSDDPMERLRAKYDGTGIQVGRDPYKMIERLADHVLSQNDLIEQLSQDAEYGKQAREEKLTELDKAVVRAFGASGSEERIKRHRKAAGPMDMAELQATIDDLNGRGDARIPGGQSTRTEDAPNGEADDSALVDENIVPRGRTPHKLVY